MIKPTTIITPKIPNKPISKFIPITIINITTTKITDIITDKQIPIKQPIPIHYNNITIPQQKKSELINIAITSFKKPNRSPIIKKTTTTPTYITKTYYKPNIINFPNDNIQSTSSIKQSYPKNKKN